MTDLDYMPEARESARDILASLPLKKGVTEEALEKMALRIESFARAMVTRELEAVWREAVSRERRSP